MPQRAWLCSSQRLRRCGTPRLVLWGVDRLFPCTFVTPNFLRTASSFLVVCYQAAWICVTQTPLQKTRGHITAYFQDTGFRFRRFPTKWRGVLSVLRWQPVRMDVFSPDGVDLAGLRLKSQPRARLQANHARPLKTTTTTEKKKTTKSNGIISNCNHWKRHRNHNRNHHHHHDHHPPTTLNPKLISTNPFRSLSKP